jgi:hypothetical protein
MTETAEAEVRSDEESPRYYGRVIIEWPALREGRVLPGWGCSIFDAETGQPIVTAEKIVIPSVTATAQDVITCDLTMFADPSGMPVLFPREDGNLTIWQAADAGIKTGTFLFEVAEMRVRS